MRLGSRSATELRHHRRRIPDSLRRPGKPDVTPPYARPRTAPGSISSTRRRNSGRAPHIPTVTPSARARWWKESSTAQPRLSQNERSDTSRSTCLRPCRSSPCSTPRRATCVARSSSPWSRMATTPRPRISAQRGHLPRCIALPGSLVTSSDNHSRRPLPYLARAQGHGRLGRTGTRWRPSRPGAREHADRPRAPGVTPPEVTCRRLLERVAACLTDSCRLRTR